MIKLPDNIAPDQATLDQLNTWQAEITRAGDFPAQSALAKRQFKSRNTKRNPAFVKVRKALTAMCSGVRRCVYCEDSVADEVEHIAPKDLYPERVFVWDNYIYACGSCNGSKNNKFAVFVPDNPTIRRVNPPHNPAHTRPPAGMPVLINPRIEDPLHFALLDIRSTFKFVCIPDADEVTTQRYNYTFNEVLCLNHEDREFLRAAREEAYGDYKARLVVYDQQRRAGTPQAELDRIITQIRRKCHPAVWHEMQRWYNLGWLAQSDPTLNDLFIDNPEALTW